MKIEIIIGIIGILVLTGLAFFYADSHSQTLSNLNAATNLLSNSTQQNALNKAVQSGATTLNTALIATHATPEDCWLLINAKVYDVTQYLVLHPGGRSIIIPFCGKDATTAFQTQAGQGSHSQTALSQLENFYIGDLNMTLAQPPNPITITPETLLNTETTPTNTTQTTTIPTNITLDAATVARHNNASDCWLIINNSVYAVSGYLARHPGGTSIIVPFCGKDATTAFQTQAGQGSHSSFATSQLASFKIGTLGATTTVQEIQKTQEIINTLPSQTSGEDEDEEEREEEEEEEEEDDD